MQHHIEDKIFISKVLEKTNKPSEVAYTKVLLLLIPIEYYRLEKEPHIGKCNSLQLFEFLKVNLIYEQRKRKVVCLHIFIILLLQILNINVIYLLNHIQLWKYFLPCGYSSFYNFENYLLNLYACQVFAFYHEVWQENGFHF